MENKKDVLSQNEISDLLNVIRSDSDKFVKPQKQVRIYDFNRPEIFNESELNKIIEKQNRFIELFKDFLCKYLKGSVKLIKTKDQSSLYIEYKRSIMFFEQIAVIKTFSAEKYINISVSHMDPSKGLLSVDVAKIIVKLLLDSLSICWEDIILFKSEIERIESDPFNLSSDTDNDMVFECAYQVQSVNINVNINICIPYSFFAAFKHKLNTDPVQKKTIISKEKPILIEVELGRQKIDKNSFSKLEHGSCLVFNNSLYGEYLNITINNVIKYRGSAVVKDGYFAVVIENKVNDQITRQDEENDYIVGRLGKTYISIAELSNINVGSVIMLDTKPSNYTELLLDKKIINKGNISVKDNTYFCIEIIDELKMINDLNRKEESIRGDF